VYHFSLHALSLSSAPLLPTAELILRPARGVRAGGGFGGGYCWHGFSRSDQI